MRQSRPVYLNLLTIKLPLAGFVSILHRITGLILFLFIPFALWILYHSLHSETDFVFLTLNLKKPFFKILLWIGLSALGYHLLAGLRHLLADLHIATSKQGGTNSAAIVLILAIILSTLIGYGLC